MNARRCEAPFEPPCTNPHETVTVFEGDTFLTCLQCDRDLRDFATYHAERDLAGPLKALKSWMRKP